MLVVYIAALLAGLALAVRVMVAGIVRPAPVLAAKESVPARRARLSPALGAVGASVPGVIGASLTKLDLLGGGARLVVALLAAGIGEIAFRYDGVRRVRPARAVDGLEPANGAPVVIDRIDSGTAWVESWAQVETRL